MSGPLSGNAFQSLIVGNETIPGLYVQCLGHGSIALIMEYGGHHTDLMYSSPANPPSITKARQIKKDYI